MTFRVISLFIDFDGMNFLFSKDSKPSKIIFKGTLGGYVKVGDALKWNSY
jgi:hypothetical protein